MSGTIEYHIDDILTPALVLYGMLIANPCIIYNFVNNSGGNLTFMEIICIYGYSLLPLGIGMGVSVIPSSYCTWLSIGMGVYYPFILNIKEFW